MAGGRNENLRTRPGQENERLKGWIIGPYWRCPTDRSTQTGRVLRRTTGDRSNLDVGRVPRGKSGPTDKKKRGSTVGSHRGRSSTKKPPSECRRVPAPSPQSPKWKVLDQRWDWGDTTSSGVRRHLVTVTSLRVSPGVPDCGGVCLGGVYLRPETHRVRSEASPYSHVGGKDGEYLPDEWMKHRS